jgi:hypothetical protein
VIKQVTNDNGGTRSAGDFTITINGVNAAGANAFAGSSTGVTKVITEACAYTVTEAQVAGCFLVGTAGDCAGTIAFGERRTCTLFNDDQAP